MKFQFPKGIGTAFLNAVRAEAFQQQSVLRPIGFKIGDSNVLDTPECVIEDMTTFITDVSAAFFHTKSTDLLQVVQCSFSDELMLSQLLANSGITADRDFVILHSNSEVTVSIVFRLDCGQHLSQGNGDLLKDHGYTRHVPINSRHSTIDSFVFHKVGENDTHEEFEVTVNTFDGESPSIILSAAAKALSSEIDEILKNVD